MDNGNGKTSPGLQAYRWLVMGGIAVIGVLSMRVLDRIDKTADAVASLQSWASTIAARTDAHGERISTHDRKIERLEDKVFRPSPN